MKVALLFVAFLATISGHLLKKKILDLSNGDGGAGGLLSLGGLSFGVSFGGGLAHSGGLGHSAGGCSTCQQGQGHHTSSGGGVHNIGGGGSGYVQNGYNLGGAGGGGGYAQGGYNSGGGLQTPDTVVKVVKVQPSSVNVHGGYAHSGGVCSTCEQGQGHHAGGGFQHGVGVDYQSPPDTIVNIVKVTPSRVNVQGGWSSSLAGRGHAASDCGPNGCNGQKGFVSSHGTSGYGLAGGYGFSKAQGTGIISGECGPLGCGQPHQPSGPSGCGPAGCGASNNCGPKGCDSFPSSQASVHNGAENFSNCGPSRCSKPRQPGSSGCGSQGCGSVYNGPGAPSEISTDMWKFSGPPQEENRGPVTSGCGPSGCNGGNGLIADQNSLGHSGSNSFSSSSSSSFSSSSSHAVSGNIAWPAAASGSEGCSECQQAGIPQNAGVVSASASGSASSASYSSSGSWNK